MPIYKIDDKIRFVLPEAPNPSQKGDTKNYEMREKNNTRHIMENGAHRFYIHFYTEDVLHMINLYANRGIAIDGLIVLDAEMKNDNHTLPNQQVLVGTNGKNSLELMIGEGDLLVAGCPENDKKSGRLPGQEVTIYPQDLDEFLNELQDYNS